MEHTLNFVSELIWQLILIAVLFHFRKEVSQLIKRIKKGKLAGNEFEFESQLPSPTAETIKPSPEEDSKEDLSDEDGFLTQAGVTNVVTLSPTRSPDEQPKSVLLIFSTPHQRTWLVATNQNLYCVLDGEKTRDTGRLLQWRLPMSQELAVSAREKNRRTGLLNIGPRKNWLYSRALYPTPESLENAVTELISDSS